MTVNPFLHCLKHSYETLYAAHPDSSMPRRAWTARARSSLLAALIVIVTVVTVNMHSGVTPSASLRLWLIIISQGSYRTLTVSEMFVELQLFNVLLKKSRTDTPVYHLMISTQVQMNSNTHKSRNKEQRVLSQDRKVSLHWLSSDAAQQFKKERRN